MEEENEDADADEEVKREFSTSWGSRFMIFRILVNLVVAVGAVPRWVWQRCSGTTKAHVSDSYVYRYEREVGFLRADAAEEAADAGIRAARERLRQDNAGAPPPAPMLLCARTPTLRTLCLYTCTIC